MFLTGRLPAVRFRRISQECEKLRTCTATKSKPARARVLDQKPDKDFGKLVTQTLYFALSRVALSTPESIKPMMLPVALVLSGHLSVHYKKSTARNLAFGQLGQTFLKPLGHRKMMQAGMG
jgi:hypothetical protein